MCSTKMWLHCRTMKRSTSSHILFLFTILTNVLRKVSSSAEGRLRLRRKTHPSHLILAQFICLLPTDGKMPSSSSQNSAPTNFKPIVGVPQALQAPVCPCKLEYLLEISIYAPVVDAVESNACPAVCAIRGKILTLIPASHPPSGERSATNTVDYEDYYNIIHFLLNK